MPFDELCRIGAIKIDWIDHGRAPTVKPNPAYPNGVDIDLSRGAEKTCLVDLPYPARRCGRYVITCPDCGLSAFVTTAGRADDPRSLKIGCGQIADIRTVATRT